MCTRVVDGSSSERILFISWSILDANIFDRTKYRIACLVLILSESRLVKSVY